MGIPFINMIELNQGVHRKANGRSKSPGIVLAHVSDFYDTRLRKKTRWRLEKERAQIQIGPKSVAKHGIIHMEISAIHA
jgi:hypothetical protein